MPFAFGLLFPFTGQQNFSVKSQIVNILWFVSLRVSHITPPHFCTAEEASKWGRAPRKLDFQNGQWAGFGTQVRAWGSLVYLSLAAPIWHSFSHVELWSFIFLFGRVCLPSLFSKIVKAILGPLFFHINRIILGIPSKPLIWKEEEFPLSYFSASWTEQLTLDFQSYNTFSFSDCLCLTGLVAVLFIFVVINIF